MIQYDSIPIEQAAFEIQVGRLVAFPTETVYGLGADATNDHAVAAIYAAKGRPQFNPLITHVLNADHAYEFAINDARAQALMSVFWPGPLTLILPRRPDSKLSLLVSAGLDCVGLRAPDHPLAQALITHSQRPLAAPSANRSGRISPTLATHVAEELGDACKIIEGGACRVGIESTVLDLSSVNAELLRYGSVTKEQIESVIGPIRSPESAGVMKSPGMMLSHYAPNARLRMNIIKPSEYEAFLMFGKPPVSYNQKKSLNLSPAADPKEAAANLFAMLRALDAMGVTSIAVMPIPMEGLGLAINDRLSRAAADR